MCRIVGSSAGLLGRANTPGHLLIRPDVLGLHFCMRFRIAPSRACVGLGPSSRWPRHGFMFDIYGRRFQVCTVRVLRLKPRWLLTQRASQVHLYPEAPNLEWGIQLPLSSSDGDNTARKEAAPGPRRSTKLSSRGVGGDGGPFQPARTTATSRRGACAGSAVHEAPIPVPAQAEGRYLNGPAGA